MLLTSRPLIKGTVETSTFFGAGDIDWIPQSPTNSVSRESGVAAIPTAFPSRFASSASAYSPSAFRKRSEGVSLVRPMRSSSALAASGERSRVIRVRGLTPSAADVPRTEKTPGSATNVQLVGFWLVDFFSRSSLILLSASISQFAEYLYGLERILIRPVEAG